MTTAKKNVPIREDYVDSRSAAIDGPADGFNELVDHLLQNSCLTDS